MVLLIPIAILLVIITLIASLIAKRLHGNCSVKHLKWVLANSVSFLITCLLFAAMSEGTIVLVCAVPTIGFAVFAAIEGYMLWEKINEQKKLN